MHLLAAAMAGRARAASATGRTPAGPVAAPAGWRNVAAVPERRRFADASDEATVCYRPLRDGRIRWGVGADVAPDGAGAQWRDEPARVDVVPAGGSPDGPVTVSVDDGVLHRRLAVTIHPASTVDDGTGEAQVYVDDGTWSTSWQALPRFRDSSQEAAAHGPSTPVPGTVTVVSVAPATR